MNEQIQRWADFVRNIDNCVDCMIFTRNCLSRKLRLFIVTYLPQFTIIKLYDIKNVKEYKKIH